MPHIPSQDCSNASPISITPFKLQLLPAEILQHIITLSHVDAISLLSLRRSSPDLRNHVDQLEQSFLKSISTSFIGFYTGNSGQQRIGLTDSGKELILKSKYIDQHPLEFVRQNPKWLLLALENKNLSSKQVAMLASLYFDQNSSPFMMHPKIPQDYFQMCMPNTHISDWLHPESLAQNEAMSPTALYHLATGTPIDPLIPYYLTNNQSIKTPTLMHIHQQGIDLAFGGVTEIPIHMVHDILHDASESEKEMIAGQSNLDDKAISIFMNSTPPNPDVLRKLSANKATGLPFLKTLFKEELLHHALSANENLNVDLFDQLNAKNNAFIYAELLRNPSLPRHLVDLHLYQQPQNSNLIHLAQHTNLKAADYEHLYKIGNINVIKKLCVNPATPAHIIRSLELSSNPEIQTYISQNESISDEAIQFLSRTGNTEVLQNLMQNDRVQQAFTRI